MPPRRSHQKSRRGCLTCKRAHVKCTQTGPPCGRCKLRGTACEYLYASPDSNSLAQAQDPPLLDRGAPVAATEEEPPPPFPNEAGLLDLQLMHRWSTVTYKSLCSKVAEDDYIWQIAVPRWSLQHDFLRAGLFALAAFDSASCCSAASGSPDRAKYLAVAVEYQTHALNSFRRRLQQHQGISDKETCEVLLCFSLMLMVLALASSQFMVELACGSQGGGGGDDDDSMVLNTLTHFELLRGCSTVLGDTAEQYLAQNSYIQKLIPFEMLPRSPLDDDTAVALSQLKTANTRRINSTVDECCQHQVQHAAHSEACKKAITMLEECFAKCVGQGKDLDYQGYVLGWLNMAGEDYVYAIRANDHVALLVLMHWGALVERLGRRVWWARDFGRLLVEEISAKALQRQTADDLTTDLIASARRIMNGPAV
ncbi:Fungal Zn binuclear cluster domain containing protein [Fonsecaea pedrosoi]|nr:Fungal Zn binuclear cluster domain containing protein [Fonsecaea pedrosoi]